MGLLRNVQVRLDLLLAPQIDGELPRWRQTLHGPTVVLERARQRQRQRARVLAAVAHERVAQERVFLVLQRVAAIPHHDHGEDPRVHQVLDPVRDGLDGVESRFEVVILVLGHGGEVDPFARHLESQVGEGDARLEGPGRGDQLVHRVPGVLDAPEAAGVAAAEVLDHVCLGESDVPVLSCKKRGIR